MLDFFERTCACVYLRWSIVDKYYQTRSLKTTKRKRNFPVSRWWFGSETFSRIQESVGVAAANHGNRLFVAVLHCSQHRFYMKQIHWDRSIHRELWYDTNVVQTVPFFIKLVSPLRLWSASTSRIYITLCIWADCIFKKRFPKNRHKECPSDIWTLGLIWTIKVFTPDLEHAHDVHSTLY